MPDKSNPYQEAANALQDLERLSVARQALNATLRDMALEYARKQVREYRSLIRGSRVDIPHYTHMLKKYGDQWKEELAQAKRNLAHDKKCLTLWNARLAALKDLE